MTALYSLIIIIIIVIIIIIISKAQIHKKPSALYKEHDGSGGVVHVQKSNLMGLSELPVRPRGKALGW